MAKQAVGRWHYSRNMPGRFRWAYSVKENGRFIGALLFDTGASPALASSFGLEADGDKPEIMELLRVALDVHKAPVSRILGFTVKILRKANPRLRLLVSFADSEQGHHGGIYQACGWYYLGESRGPGFIVNGEQIHAKTLYARYGVGGQSVSWLRANVDAEARRFLTPVKYRYALPLDEAMRAKLAPLAQPYPKRAGSIDSDATDYQSGEGGANPTPALDLFGGVT